MITRLFDIVAQRSAEEPDAAMLAAKESGEWKTYSCKEVWETAQGLAAGLIELGISQDVSSVENQEKIAIISLNRPEWIITDVAAQLCGAVLTPIYPTVSSHDIEFILNQSEVRVLFIQTANSTKGLEKQLVT